jgi:hypothetical protein
MTFFRDPKRLLATLIAGVAGLIVLIDFTARIPIIDVLARLIINWVAVLTGIAVLIGILSVTASHIRRIGSRGSDWPYSVILVLAMLFTVLSGTVIGFVPGGWVSPANLAEQPLRDLFNAVYQPLAASFLALLAFFSLSAIFRAIQRRTAEALVITIVAGLVLSIAALPPSQVTALLGDGMRWVTDYLVLAGARGLLIGAALGAIVAGVRVLLSHTWIAERSSSR